MHMRMLFLGLFFASCAAVQSPEEGLVPLGEGLYRLTATVRSIVDQVPADGGVMIQLEDGEGHSFEAWLPSFFRMPPPPQSDWDLYTSIQKLRSGDRVVIIGPLTDAGIRIMGLEQK